MIYQASVTPNVKINCLWNIFSYYLLLKCVSAKVIQVVIIFWLNTSLSWCGMILLILLKQAGAAFRSGVKGQMNIFFTVILLNKGVCILLACLFRVVVLESRPTDNPTADSNLYILAGHENSYWAQHASTQAQTHSLPLM